MVGYLLKIDWIYPMAEIGICCQNSVLSIALANNTTKINFKKKYWLVSFLLKISVPNKKFSLGLVWSCFVLLFSVPNKKNHEQYWILGISGIEIQNFKFWNSCFVFGTETGREMASPKWRDWDGTAKRMFLNARDGKFPRFFREKSGSREMAFGNADL